MNPKVNEIYQKLKTGLKDFQQSERWKDYLRFSSRFHHYSFGNTVLIWLHNPNASRVAGFRKWNELGRFVKAGERGIPIFVPMIYKKKPNPAECLNDEQKEEEVLRGFRIGYVFDISQTEGKPVPELVKTLPQTVTGETLYPKFKALSPVPVSEEDIGMNGYYHIEEKRIVIKNDNTPDQKCKTVIHEIAHAILHTKQHDFSREAEELIAESVAYVVCSQVGLDTGDYSFGYLSSWKGDEGKMEEIGEAVMDVAGFIIEKVNLNIST